MSVALTIWLCAFWTLAVSVAVKISDIAKAVEKIAKNTEKEGEQK